MYKTILGFLLIASSLFGIFPTTQVIASAQTNQDPFISEINFRGAVSSSRCINETQINNYKASTNWCGKDQWLEIANPSSQKLDLNGYSLDFRNKKSVSLSGYFILAGGYIVINFTQSNFKSIIKDVDLSSYNLLYISSESGVDTAAHNVTAILKSGETIVDSINTHPNIFSPDYLNSRGKSFFRCNQNDNWQTSIYKYGTEDNYATPKQPDPSCNKNSSAAIPITPPVVNKVTPLKPTLTETKLSQTRQVNHTKTGPIKVNSTVKVSEQVHVPKFELANISELNLNRVAKQSFTSSENKSTLIADQSYRFDPILLPNSNLNTVYKYQFNNILGYYYQDNLTILNLLLLTGLLFRYTKNINTKLFNLLYYASRIKKRWQLNF